MRFFTVILVISLCFSVFGSDSDRRADHIIRGVLNEVKELEARIDRISNALNSSDSTQIEQFKEIARSMTSLADATQKVLEITSTEKELKRKPKTILIIVGLDHIL